MFGYYDLVLALVPLGLVGVSVALTVVGLSMTAAVPVGATVAATLIGHAMFVNAPTRRTEEPATRSPTGGGRAGGVNSD